MFLEMNNGRILTLYDLGRFDLVIRSGLGTVPRKKRWGLVVAGSTVQYRRRIKIFDKVTIRTQIVGLQERWIYLAQSMWVKNQPTSSVLLRTGVTAKGQVVSIEDISKVLGIEPWIHETEGWVQSWIESEAKRPWPPK
jgi:acyl-CoA thioesterase FadM